jgi:glycosyltransferase involved in cell wall biosynthesis
MKKKAVVFTLHYPFHFSDSYINEEINYISEGFEKVLIVSSNMVDEQTRIVPSNVEAFRFRPEITLTSKLRALTLVFRPFFYKEIRGIQSRYAVTLSFAILKELFAYYARAIETKLFLAELLKKHNFCAQETLIYTYWMLEPTLAASLLKQANKDLIIISRAHSQDVYFDRLPIKYQPYKLFVFNSLSNLYFISEHARSYFQKIHQLTREEKGRTRLSRIGVKNHQTFLPSITRITFKILSVAYVQKLKRIDLIVKSLALLKDVQIEWHHVGHSYHHDLVFEEVSSLAVSLLNNTNVSFLFMGERQKEQLYNLYKEHNYDCFLSLSETEGIPVSMMEAMSYSVPVISTNVGGVAEIVEDRKNGFLLPSNPTSEEAADKLKEFFSLSIDKRDFLRQNAYNTWNEKFNAEKNYQSFVQEILAL